MRVKYLSGTKRLQTGEQKAGEYYMALIKKFLKLFHKNNDVASLIAKAVGSN